MNDNGEKNSWQRFAFGWFSLLAGLVGAVVSITLAVTQPDAQMARDIALIQKDISTIKTNDLEHIRAELEKHDQRFKEDGVVFEKILERLTRIETLLEK